MDSTTLVVPPLDAGRKLLQDLERDAKHLDFKAAFWLLDAETRRWRLILATPLVSTQGPLHVYEVVQKYLLRRPARYQFALPDITVVAPHDRLVRALRERTDLQPTDTAPIHLFNASVGDMFIEDAYVYRLETLPGKRNAA